MAAEATIVALGFAALWSIICRVSHLHPKETTARSFVQHFALGIGVASALFLPDPIWSKAALLFGVVVFLGIGARFWQHGAPPWAKK